LRSMRRSLITTGATLLKRRHLELLGHALVSVPYWDWDACKGSGDSEQYLRGTLEARQGIMTHSQSESDAWRHGSWRSRR
jgi:hypothetical protein